MINLRLRWSKYFRLPAPETQAKSTVVAGSSFAITMKAWRHCLKSMRSCGAGFVHAAQQSADLQSLERATAPESALALETSTCTKAPNTGTRLCGCTTPRTLASMAAVPLVISARSMPTRRYQTVPLPGITCTVCSDADMHNSLYTKTHSRDVSTQPTLMTVMRVEP